MIRIVEPGTTEDQTPGITQEEIQAIAEEQTLPAMLRTVAHRATDTQLVVVCTASLLGAVAILIFAQGWWRVALIFIALTAFGVWAIAERDGSERRSVRVLKGVAAVAGVLSAFAFGLSLLTSALGTWIS
jgi:hypothetical protein